MRMPRGMHNMPIVREAYSSKIAKATIAAPVQRWHTRQ